MSSTARQLSSILAPQRVLSAMDSVSLEERRRLFNDCVAVYQESNGRLSMDLIMMVSIMCGRTEGGAWLREAIPAKDREKACQEAMHMNLPKKTVALYTRYLLGVSGGAV